MAATHTLADRILQRAPLAVEMAKQLVNDGLDASLPTAITQEMGMTATLYATADAREGIAAFIEKRPPRFHRQLGSQRKEVPRLSESDTAAHRSSRTRAASWRRRLADHSSRRETREDTCHREDSRPLGRHG